MEKVGTSNQDRTISLKAALRSCINKQTKRTHGLECHRLRFGYLTIYFNPIEVNINLYPAMKNQRESRDITLLFL